MCCHKNLKTKQLHYQEEIDGINISEQKYLPQNLGTYHAAQNYAFPLAITYSGEGIIKMV
jgi:hypothetical protein